MGGLNRTHWLIATAIGSGLIAGLGSFTFSYGQGDSYFSESAEACGNCHIMNAQLDAWRKGPHRSAAACNDCHAPHDGLLNKLWVKGNNGYRHALSFTTGNFTDPIAITESNRNVTEAACRHCHSALTNSIEPKTAAHSTQMSCLRCHSQVGHDD